MSTWTTAELDDLGAASEIGIAPRRDDGSLHGYTTIWVVRVGDDLFVRSYNGRDGSWYRTARRSGAARIRVGGTERDVTLEPASVDTVDVDAAYRAKYGHSSYAHAMTTGDTASTTLRLVPE